MLTIKVQLLLNDTKRLTTDLTYDRPIQNIIGYILDTVGDFRSWQGLCYLRGWRLIVRPVESFREDFFAGKGEVFLGDRFIIPEG